MPTVVKILSRTQEPNRASRIRDILQGDDAQRFDSVGSGVIIAADGLILTNHHVVQDANLIEVRLPDGRGFEVTETKSDPQSDVAIIRIDVEDPLPTAEIGDSDELHVGDWVLAIGSPFMLDSSVSAGIISGTGRHRQLSRVVSGQFLQTDAAINPGNSGGPLLDLDGRVIGINTAISSRTGGFQGIGFAIPIARANWIINELLNFDRVRRGRIGIGAAPLPYTVVRELGLPSSAGALVSKVLPGPGQKAGVESGDVIVEFAGQAIESATQFAELVQQSPIGQPLDLVVIRDGKQRRLTVELEERL